ncbi:MAG TPA: NAD(P)-dependent oxidoreductase [Gaiellaceae bacterium]|nr:NAD(P)-dependent oxidoreductase [Gaiellaceae bacterium]
MRIFVTGGTGALGQSLLPRLESAGHDVVAPRHAELDLFDAGAVREAVARAEAVYHLATRIPAGGRSEEPGAWDENDRLRTEATTILVDAALEGGAGVFVFPGVVLLYPPGPADETTPPAADLAPHLRSDLVAEAEVERFAAGGGRGVALRLGILWGPGSGNDSPRRSVPPLHTEDAADALLRALDLPSGVYNVLADGFPVSNERFKRATGWRPER